MVSDKKQYSMNKIIEILMEGYDKPADPIPLIPFKLENIET